MSGLLDHLAASPRAEVLGDYGLAVDDSDGPVIDDERADVPGVIGRHRIAIGVDADKRLEVDLHGLDAIRLRQRIG